MRGLGPRSCEPCSLPALAGIDLRTGTATDPLVGLSPFSLVLPVQPVDAPRRGPGG